MAFAFVQSRAGGSTTSVVLSYLSALTSGSLLVGAAYWNDTGNSATVSDSVNGSWTAAGSPQNGAGALSAYRFQCFYDLSNAATTAATVTCTSSAGADVALAIHEYTGTSVALNGTPSYSNFTGSTTVTSGTVTTTVANAMLFCGCVTSNAASTAGAGYTKREGANFGSNITEDDLDAGAAGSQTATFTVAGSGDNTIVGLIAFSEGGGAAAAVSTVDIFDPIPFMSNLRI